MDPTNDVLAERGVARSWTFHNTAPYAIVICDDFGVGIMNWKLEQHIVSLCPSTGIRDDQLSEKMQLEVWCPTQPTGFNGLSSRRYLDNIIVTTEVGQYMKNISYRWGGRVVSPDISDKRARFENDCWYVHRMLVWE